MAKIAGMKINTNAGQVLHLPTEIGNHIYAWSPGGVKPVAGQRDCVITSHGGLSTREGEGRPVGDEILHFYCKHEYAMTTSSGTLAQIAARELNYHEAVPLAELGFNYDLTKFQGSHGGPGGRVIETYHEIQVGLTRASRQAQIRSLIDQRFKGATEEAFDAVRETDMDVITIRNRSRIIRGTTPTLNGVIRQLHSAGYYYRHIHCAFCRVVDGKPQIGWPLSSNTHAPPAAP